MNEVKDEIMKSIEEYYSKSHQSLKAKNLG